MARITVIVPVYQAEPWLPRCLDSLLTQTFSDFELLLAEDGSQDGSASICERCARQDRRVHVLHLAHGGLSAARNAGIDWAMAHSGSQWLSFVDADDWVHPRFLELLLEAAERYNAGISQCLHRRIPGPEIPAPGSPEMTALTPSEAYQKPFGVAAWNKLYRKTCFSKVRYPVGRIYEDVFTTYRVVFSETQVAFVDAPLYNYVQTPESITRRPWTPARMDQIDAWEEQLAFFAGFPDPALLRHVARETVTAVGSSLEALEKRCALESGERRRYRRLLRRKLRRYLLKYRVPFSDSRWLYERAWPGGMWCYWTARGVGNKLRMPLRHPRENGGSAE